MVKATMVIKLGNVNPVIYKPGDELPPELAWEFELFNRALLDSYQLVNGKYVLKPGEKPVEKPKKVFEAKAEVKPVVAKATGKKVKK